MGSLTNSDTEEAVARTSRLSQHSPDDLDEQTTQLPPDGLTTVNRVSPPSTSTNDNIDDLALALTLSELASSNQDERVAPLYRMGSSPSTPPKESDEDELGQQRKPRMAVDDNLASPLMAMSVGEDGMQGASGLTGDTSESVLRDDYSQALASGRRGTSLLERYENSGVLAELEEAISALSIADRLIPESHSMKPTCLNNLGSSLRVRFERLGGIADLDKAITVTRLAVHLTPNGHPQKPVRLSNLGTSFQSRFESLSSITDLNEAITAQRQALFLTPDDHPHMLARLNQLGTCFQRRFEHLGDITDLGEAITLQQQAILLIPDNHPHKPECLNDLATSFQSRFERLGDIADLTEAITTQEHAIRLTPDNHPDKPGHLNDLGIFFQCRFQRLGDIADLGGAITAKQQAASLTPDDHPGKPTYLNNLGNSLQSRFDRTGDLANLDEAITAQRWAIHLTPDGYHPKSGYLNNLGISLHSRFVRLGAVADLNEAITAKQQAVRLTPDNHPHKPACLNNLAISLHSRFERLGDIVDLSEAITVQRQAVRLTPEGHPDKPERLDNLGNFLQCRCEHLGDISSLDEAIATQQQAVHIMPDGHLHKPGCLNNLGTSFFLRFERRGGTADLDEAIKAEQEAARLTPHNHPEKPRCLSNLGTSLFLRFVRLGDIADLDEAIVKQREAVRLTLDDHPHKPRHLDSLGLSFQSRFERLGDITDLGEAITTQRQAVSLTPDGHPGMPKPLHNLGNSFQIRFEPLGNLANLNKAIATKQQAVSLTPDSHPDKPGRLSSLGTSFRSRFERLGDIADLNEAITAQEEAVRLIPDGHPHRPGCLTGLGNSFRQRFERLGDVADLEEAITAQQEAVHLTPDGHHDKPGILNNLGTSFCARLRHHHDDATLAQAISTYSRSATSSSGPPSHRFAAAHMWATLCFSVRSNETLDAYSTLIDLLPRVIWLGRTVEQRYKDISPIVDAVMDAATTAIHLGKFDLALEWLEQGRSIVWGQMLQLRTPLDNLRQYHPHEADELEKISRALESAGMVQNLSHSNIATSETLEEAARAHRRLADEYDRIVNRIRSFPNFRQFLLPRKSASLCHAAISGPVVVVNAHTTRCDALILHPHSSQVCHVPLPGFQASAAREMQLQLAGLTRGNGALHRDYVPYNEDDSEGSSPRTGVELSDIFRQLWLHIVVPILRYLEILQKPVAGSVPHVTWCLTGPLTFVPIHAAGHYDAKDQPKIFDYVVSSYTPTLTALLSAKRPFAHGGGVPRLLAVSQPATPRQRWLPGTVREVNAIQAIQASTGHLLITRLNDREATVAAVLQAMKECNWIHLACHGVQDTTSATDSAFVLVDGKLTLKEIMKQSFSHTELAVLSACQTAKGDKNLGDEAVHLAAGMLMAGYRSIVASMWSIRDDDGPIIAEQFYEYLVEETGGDSGRAAYALHDAVAHLRDVRGENNFASWVPFIHLGICSLPK